MKRKNLNKKIRRLAKKIQSDTKKLTKLRLKLSTPAKKKKKREARKSAKSAKAAKTSKRKRGRLTPEGRARLAAAMNARWAAKRAAAATREAATEKG